jgi:methylated-DNA-[protein]-cysteine S-methyltransferase
MIAKLGNYRFRVARRGRGEDNARMVSAMRFSYADSPLGPLLLGGSDRMLHVVSFADGRGARRPQSGWMRDDDAFVRTVRQIDAYFAGALTEFDLHLVPAGNVFQRAVWQAMRAIPYGETRSYGELAVAAGETVAASRAVGAACGDNPLPIVIPCHRVVGSNKSLTGFGGGIARKKYLLDLEFRVRPPADTLFAALAAR